MDNSVYRKLCRNYEASTRAMMDEIREKKNNLRLVSTETVDSYLYDLAMLRSFLDNHGLLMPKPKWHFDYHDYSTWLYSVPQGTSMRFKQLHKRRFSKILEAHKS